jgi:hypothetical protein
MKQRSVKEFARNHPQTYCPHPQPKDTTNYVAEDEVSTTLNNDDGTQYSQKPNDTNTRSNPTTIPPLPEFKTALQHGLFLPWASYNHSSSISPLHATIYQHLTKLLYFHGMTVTRDDVCTWMLPPGTQQWDAEFHEVWRKVDKNVRNLQTRMWGSAVVREWVS